MKTKINSEKGFISAVIEKQKNTAKGVVVFLPAYLDSKDYPSFVTFSERMAKAGFITIRFDPTGTWESSGSIGDYTISQYLSDVETVVSFAKTLDKSLKNIILVGHSLGGLVGIIYAARHRGVSMVIAIQPPQEKKWEKASARLSKRDLPGDKSKKLEFKVPYSFVEDSKRYNALNLVPQVTAPLVLISGALDDIVPPKSVEEVYNKANNPKKFEVLGGVSHDFRHSLRETRIVADKIEEIINESFG